MLTGAAHRVEYASLMGIDQLPPANDELPCLHHTDVVGHGGKLSGKFGLVFGLVKLEIGHDVIGESEA